MDDSYRTMREYEVISTPVDFYLENYYCTSCAVPQVVAPDLVGWLDDQMSHCHLQFLLPAEKGWLSAGLGCRFRVAGRLLVGNN